MGKNYAESSLKHYLKQKVRITLGLVVTFLITGAFAFAEGTAEKPVEEMSDFEKAEYYLQGINNENNKLSKLMNSFKDVTNGTEGIKLDKDNNKIILEKFNKGNDIEITLNNENISNETAKNIKTALENGANNITNINNIGDKTLSNVTNDSIILSNEYGTNGNSINNGIIFAKGQTIGENQTTVNNGIVVFNLIGQNVSGNFGTAVNNGLLIYSKSGVEQGQVIGSKEKSSIINNGILINGYQHLNGSKKDSKAYNYGVIENGYQRLSGTSSSYAYNYGIIKSGTNVGQNFNGNSSFSTLKNYGLILGNKGQSLTGKNNTAENYGVIEGNNANGSWLYVEGQGNKGFNYGTVISGTDVVTNDKNGNVTNKGLVFLTNHEKGTNDNKINVGTNQGILFDKNGAIINSDEVAEYSNGSSVTNTFTDSKSTAYLNGTGNKITENLSDKVIGTVVKNDISNADAVIKADKDLVLTDTVITGYFENNGTLLDMGDNDLTLLGDTKIVASRDDFSLNNITALKINGNLKTLGGAEVAGKIVGNGNVINVAVTDNSISANMKEVILQNAKDDEIKYLKGETEEEKAKNNYTDITYSDLTTDKVTLDFSQTAAGKENTITFTDNLLIKGENGVAVGVGENYNDKDNININFSSLDSEKVKGDIKLGSADDDIIVEKNGEYNHIIDMGAGNDTFTVNGFADSITKADNHKELGTFNYKLAGVETITLKGDGITGNNGWHIGKEAEIVSKGENGTKLIIDNEQLHIDMNNNYGKGDVVTSLDKLAGENGANGLVIETSKDDTGKDTGLVKFTVGDEFNVSDKKFSVAADYDLSNANLGTAVIFKGTGENGAVEQNEKGEVELTVKEASELGLSGYEGIYSAVLGALSSSKYDEIRNTVNYADEKDFVELIEGAGNTAEAFYTTGYAVTKDVTDTYMSVVEDFGRKAGKGEWIAYGKYVNSDTEFDGGKASKGYDGDITGTVGMVEYGVNDTTSYGIVYGQGDTEVDIDCGGKLDGDNSYFGGYIKHRTQNGIDLTGNIGYTKSELDLKLVTDTKYQSIITDGTSDSDALTFSLKAKKDYKLTDTVKLQPVVGARYTLVNQDAVESSDANFRMDEQDVTIFEGMFGGSLVKEFDIYNGKLALSVGAEYVLTDVSKSEDARYKLYDKDVEFIGEEDIADNRIEGHIGAEYIHENGVGIDAKYEMIWTDKGDTDRITAGVSYKF